MLEHDIVRYRHDMFEHACMHRMRVMAYSSRVWGHACSIIPEYPFRYARWCLSRLISHELEIVHKVLYSWFFAPAWLTCEPNIVFSGFL